MRKSYYIVYLPVLLLVSACTKDIQNLNSNPKAALSVPATSLFLAGEKGLVDDYTTTSSSIAPFRVFAQSWTENTYTSEAKYILTAYNSPDNWWAYLYGAESSDGVISNLEDAKISFPSTVSDTVELNNDLIITDILEIYSYDLLVTTYGNIPYSQAENRSIPFPKYDDAKTVYYDLLNRLDTCIAGLNLSSPAMGTADQIYLGNVASWKKFAATLKLKMAMLIADVDPATASQKVQEAVATGVFQSNADNALFGYQSSPTGNANPIWQALINSGRHDYCPAEFMVSTLIGLNDPRLPLYYTTISGAYKGGIAGSGNNYVTLSTFSNAWLVATYPGDLLDYSETEFLLAEAVERGFPAGGTAASYYGNAVTASIEFWGGSASDAANYLVQPAVAYATASGTYRQKIGYQKWIAMANRGWDAWTEIRRLGYPDINTVSPPVGAITPLPLRFNYPLAEETSNPINWAAAVQAMSGGTSDVVTTKLFWMQ
jgi:hypothetical protein